MYTSLLFSKKRHIYDTCHLKNRCTFAFTFTSALLLLRLLQCNATSNPGGRKNTRGRTCASIFSSCFNPPFDTFLSEKGRKVNRCGAIGRGRVLSVVTTTCVAAEYLVRILPTPCIWTDSPASESLEYLGLQCRHHHYLRRRSSRAYRCSHHLCKMSIERSYDSASCLTAPLPSFAASLYMSR